MAKRNERMEKLNMAGHDTSKYFNVVLPDGLKPGATISLVINENGQPEIVGSNKNNVIPEQIIADGYVRNTKLHRRFVMAQMMHMINYKSYDGQHEGYNECLKRMYGYGYTLKMMMEEVRVLSKLENRDKESFIERSHFFTKAVVIEVMEDYLAKLKQYVDGLPVRKCKGVPYKRIKGENVFVDDIRKKIYLPIELDILDVKGAMSYNKIYSVLILFARHIVKLPFDTPKSKAWIDAFKGEGAYYTLKNLVMFHNCFVEDSVGRLYGTKAVSYINAALDAYQGEGWRMFALMKKVIADNHFNFNVRMAEIYDN